MLNSKIINKRGIINGLGSIVKLFIGNLDTYAGEKLLEQSINRWYNKSN